MAYITLAPRGMTRNKAHHHINHWTAVIAQPGLGFRIQEEKQWGSSGHWVYNFSSDVVSGAVMFNPGC